MRHETSDWLGRIRVVEREHSAARLAANRLLEEIGRDSTVLGQQLKPRDVRFMSSRLDGTYMIRLFAEFETGLRLFWPIAKRQEPPSRTTDLLDGVAANRRIPNDQRLAAHAVRAYRNLLVHERDEPVEIISLATARGRLCRFFSNLPPRW